MIPALFDVEHSAYIDDPNTTDAHGNQIDKWDDPVVKQFITWADYNTSEPGVAGHDRDEVDAGIIVYPDFGVVFPRDRMSIDGEVFEVVGVPERADKAWWACDIVNWTINLKQVNG